MLPVGKSTPIAPAVISATAALAGVILAQLIGWFQHRHEEKRRNRTELSSAMAPTLSLIMEAIEQIDRAVQSDLDWRTQRDWTRLRTETWPPVRTLLLAQASQELDPSRPDSLYALTTHLQHLLFDEEDDHSTSRRGWDTARSQAIDVQRRRLGRRPP